MREAGVVLDDGGDGEGGGAAAARVDGDKGVTDVLLGLAHIVDDGRRRARDHGLNVLGREGLFRTVGGDAQALAEQHGGVLSEERADSLHLLGTEPTRHGRELVSALLWGVRLEAVVC